MSIKLGRLCKIGIPTPWAKQLNRGDVGEIRSGMWALGDIGEGWLPCALGTFGNKDSGASDRANDDTWELFKLLWTNCTDGNLAIYDSSGGGSTRGGSALADWQANKRMALPNLQGFAQVHQAAAGDLSGLGFSTGDYQHGHDVPGHYHAVNAAGADIAIGASGSHDHDELSRPEDATASGTWYPTCEQTTQGVQTTSTETETHTHINSDFSGRVGLVTGGQPGDGTFITGPADSPIFVVFVKIAY